MLDLFLFFLAHLQTVLECLILVSELCNVLIQIHLLLRDPKLFTRVLDARNVVSVTSVVLLGFSLLSFDLLPDFAELALYFLPVAC